MLTKDQEQEKLATLEEEIVKFSNPPRNTQMRMVEVWKNHYRVNFWAKVGGNEFCPDNKIVQSHLLKIITTPEGFVVKEI